MLRPAAVAPPLGAPRRRGRSPQRRPSGEGLAQPGQLPARRPRPGERRAGGGRLSRRAPRRRRRPRAGALPARPRGRRLRTALICHLGRTTTMSEWAQLLAGPPSPHAALERGHWYRVEARTKDGIVWVMGPNAVGRPVAESLVRIINH